ncbi:MAG: nitrogenase cofactor biosynthesis protein NifB [Clostridia bacterium]
MGANIVNLNINPCKMCMPMGTVSAFSGISGCMSILHGSQGCATYIRRHMATHYNEPVDIASSSLTEEGTVFGGEKNLLKGLDNLITLYNPEVIGISTTCLAETIGEDVPRILEKFYETHPDSKVKIVNVASAGYESSQYEGFFKALRAVSEQLVEPSSEKEDFINVITPMISPADTRWLKEILTEMGLKFVLLPDLSENLDGVSVAEYNKLKNGGTTCEQIATMSSAKLTIEMSDFIKEHHSAGRFLEETYGVPLKRIPLPCGIEYMDLFLETLVKAGGKLTDKIKQERGRYLDAMVDAHKHLASARVAVFGEPDFVSSVVKLCSETGAVPVCVTTGTVCEGFEEKLSPMVEKSADLQFVEQFIVRDDKDFDDIERYCDEYGVNVLIGSSDGRRIAENKNIPLVRCAFPIHDHLGGQRVRTLGFDGSLYLIEQIANYMIDKLHHSYRGEIAEKYLGKAKSEETSAMQFLPFTKEEIEVRTKNHPCYTHGEGGCQNARMHLAVAPKCNIQCNYCVRKFDCPNESRPGVTTKVLNPEQAFEQYLMVKEKLTNLKVIGIAGPGDALANFEETREVLTKIREVDRDVTFCISTNGLMLPFYAMELVALGVTHVTVTLNTLNPQVGAKIYKHIDYLGTRYTGVEGASILLANQLSGIKMLTSQGVMVKINCVAVKGVSDGELMAVSKKAKELGAFMTNIMPHIPVVGSAFENLDRLTSDELESLRSSCESNIKQMRHCKQCRADAIGTLENDISTEFTLKATPKCSQECTDQTSCTTCPSKQKTTEEKRKYKVAVATKSGTMVDVHFGQAKEFYIYYSDGENMEFIEKRNVDKYCSGAENCGDHDNKIDKIISVIGDCEYVYSLKIGQSPKEKLEARGIISISSYDLIEKAIKKTKKSVAE